MPLIQKLMDATQLDTDVLRRLDSNGDNFTVHREVDFYFKCKTQKKAKELAEFLDDFQYGNAKAITEEDEPYVQLLINMPVTQNVILCVSGFMICIAEQFEAEINGWGCIAQNGS